MDIVQWFFNCIVYILNTVIWLFSKALNLIFSILPNSPFLEVSKNYDSSVSEYMPYLAWILPIKPMIAILVAWLSAMSIYYVYSVIMRWIKLID